MAWVSSLYRHLRVEFFHGAQLPLGESESCHIQEEKTCSIFQRLEKSAHTGRERIYGALPEDKQPEIAGFRTVPTSLIITYKIYVSLRKSLYTYK